MDQGSQRVPKTFICPLSWEEVFGDGRAEESWCSQRWRQYPREGASELSWTTSFCLEWWSHPWIRHMWHQHLLCLRCCDTPITRQPSHGVLHGKHLFLMQLSQARLSRSLLFLQRPLSADFIILIFWACFQCQQKSTRPSGRSHQSVGNELCERFCHRHTLWGNRGTLFLKLTWCDPLVVWSVNILLRARFLVLLPTVRKLLGSLLYILWKLHGTGPDVNVWIRAFL